ncbi:MAG: STAS domain-containing protein [Magnetococcales bacterium]|nr:STAS domain-containing protein [Magnetococcales bacterium]
MRISEREPGKIVVAPKGKKFTYDLQRSFRKAFYKKKTGLRYVIDFKNIEYIDSMGAYMLLMLREHNNKGDESLQGEVRIINAKKPVKKVLASLRIDSLFFVK